MVSAVQEDTLNTVVGGTYEYDGGDREPSAWLYFLDYQDCEIKWFWGIEDKTRFEDLMFMNNSNYIVGILSDDDDDKFLIVVNNLNPEQLATHVKYPHIRFYELQSDSDSSFY